MRGNVSERHAAAVAALVHQHGAQRFAVAVEKLRAGRARRQQRRGERRQSGRDVKRGAGNDSKRRDGYDKPFHGVMAGALPRRSMVPRPNFSGRYIASAFVAAAAAVPATRTRARYSKVYAPGGSMSQK